MECDPLTERKYKVYLLAEVSTNKVFYVGMTDNLKGRLSQHITAARRGKSSPVCKKIRELILANSKIGLKVWARNLTLADASECEVNLIRTFGTDNLTNVVANLNWAARYERGKQHTGVGSETN